MSRTPEHRSEAGFDIDAEPPRRSRRRVTVGRIVLNLAVVAAFGVAVFVVYNLVQDSGILDGARVSKAGRSFEDVPADNPLQGSIEEAVRIGLVEPASPSRFGPTESVLRGEFAGIVARTMELDVAADEPHSFADVTGDDDVVDEADYIAVLAAEGIMGGPGGVPPSFSPSDPVLMRHLIVVFARAGGDALPEATAIDPAIEALEVSDEVRISYQRLASAGILDGVVMDSADNSLANEADREQVAAIAVNFRHFLAEAESSGTEGTVRG